LQKIENIIACQKFFPTCLASQIDLMMIIPCFGQSLALCREKWPMNQ